MGSWLEPCFGLELACTPAEVLLGVPQAAESLEEGALADPHKGCSQAEAVEGGSLPAEKGNCSDDSFACLAFADFTQSGFFGRFSVKWRVVDLRGI